MEVCNKVQEEERKIMVYDNNTNQDIVHGVVDEHEGLLPGFRFHPTDEELVSFYLKRKVEKKRPLSIEIIKEIDIYKHDPWDLAKASSSIGNKEWYFYCKRGRKYRNSIRPNRVTGSGFWKATGIDRPVYSNGGEGPLTICIGLKKSLVYYRGSAGKGTKTDWMMHEFRLPTHHAHDHHHHHTHDHHHHHHGHDHANNIPSYNPKNTALEEAEIWTLCRIFKRNKRQTPDWKELSSRKNQSSTILNSTSNTSSIDSNTNQECYISFASQQLTPTNNNNNNNNNNPYINLGSHNISNNIIEMHQQQQYWNNNPSRPTMLNHQFLTNDEYDMHHNLPYYGHTWDDLSSVVEFAFKTPLL